MTGSETKTGIGLEAAYGTPVKAQTLLDIRTNSIEGKYNRIDSKALRPGRYNPARSVMGSAELDGSLACEVTPDGFGVLLYSAMGACATTGTVAPYTHVITAGTSGPKPITIATAKGNLIAVDSCKIDSLNLNASIDDILMAEAGVVGVAQKFDQYPESTSGKIFGTASLPIGLPFTFQGAALTLDGSANADCGSFTLNFKNNLSAKRTLGNAFPNGHDPLRVECTLELDMYYESEALLRKHLGAIAGFPFSRGSVPTQSSFSAVFASGTNGSTLTIAASAVLVDAPEPPVEGQDFLKQKVTLTILDPGVIFTLVNSEADTAITAVGTPISWS